MDSVNSGWFGWFLWLLGFDASRIPSDAKSVEFQWLNMPSSWGVFLLIGGVLLIGAFVVWLYVRELDTCPKPIKLALSAARFVVLFLLVLVFLEPSLTYKQERRRDPFVMIMRDASQSMNTRDEYLDDPAAKIVAAATSQSIEQVRNAKQSRAELVNRLIAKDEYRLLRDLQRLGKVRVMDFSDQIQKVGTLPARVDVRETNSEKPTDQAEEVQQERVILELDATGRGTNIWLAIKEALNMNPLAAVVIFSDGQHTAGEQPAEIAELAKQKGVPIYVVGVGDPRRSMNINVHPPYVREKVWPNEPFEVDAVIVAEGQDFSSRKLRVELLEHRVAGDDSTGPGTIVHHEDLEIPEGGGQVRATFSHSVSTAGRYRYTIKAEQIDGERDDKDNIQISRIIEAVNRDAKVLLIAGAPTWEYRMVERLLRRDQTIQVSCWLQTLDEDRQQEADNDEMRLTRLPTTMKELGKYHVVMLFDPNPDEFDAAWVQLLKDFAAKQSGGVLYMAGPKYSGDFLGGERTGKMRDVLPVRFGDVQLTEVQTLLATNRQSWKLRIMMENIDHPVMSFYEDSKRNLQRWEELPGIYWSFPSVGPKPTAKVLLEHSDPILRRVEGSRPLLVAGRYGPANTVYIGFNGTWRWRRVGRQAEFFDKYWLQVVRYLIETRTLQSMRRGYVEPERTKYEVGEKVVFYANLKDASYEPLAMSQVDATLRSSDNQTTSVVLKSIDGQPGQYEATIIADEPGKFSLEIELAGSEGNESTKLDPAEYEVSIPSIERNNVWLNEQLLREVADNSGGQYFTVNQVNQLASVIPAQPEIFEVPGKPVLLWGEHQIPYRVLFLLLVLLTVEWAVRKGFKLL